LARERPLISAIGLPKRANHEYVELYVARVTTALDELL